MREAEDITQDLDRARHDLRQATGVVMRAVIRDRIDQLLDELGQGEQG